MSQSVGESMNSQLAKISFELRWVDIFRSQIFMMRNGLKVLFPIMWVAMSLIYLDRASESIIVFLIFSFLTAIIYLLPILLITMVITAISTLFMTGPGFTGRHTVSISEDGVYEETEVNRTSIQWSGIRAIRQNRKFILLQINLVMLLPIPKRAFGKSEEANQFYETARALWAAAKQSSET